ncbi:MAG: AAA family ATPase [Bacteroides sp.]|nr:AAA family ATPase [Prevotella sp.]MCM1407524.1 AAA family ATPase [Treponema brennaborense]MCM1470014.1 AAA family ATPase [Bacteroides sp.]
MFLKSLDIFGFKSFADRTHIEFSEGITALLGPNGCGKSNVVDAVKWVLGEQGAKNMRAEKMEDVIFAGTESRKALNVAEVALTIANEKGLLPLDMPEITIKRRIFRSGESEYFINNVQAKLKDVRELFWDTGIGKAAYSVMEQGKIDQILSSKPEDRRYLFEEAAGITRFKVKRAEAERKLERTEENMRQIEGIMGEVKKSYDSLKIQADKTLVYRSLRDDIFHTELDIQLLRLKNFSQDKSRREAEIADTEAKRNKIRAEIDEVNASVAEHLDEMNAMQNQLVDLNQRIFGLAAEQRGKQEQAKLLGAQQNDARAKLRQIEGRKAGIEERIENLQDEIDDQESSIHNVRKRLGDIVQNISSFEDNIAAAGSRITENDRQSELYAQDVQKLDDSRNDLQKSLASITEDIVAELDSKLKNAGYSSHRRAESQERAAAVVGQLKVIASGRREMFSDVAKFGPDSGADAAKVAQNAAAGFSEVEKLAAEMEEALLSFAASMPDFIDEFLSPEGIITKKRAIDRDIQDNRSAVSEKRRQMEALKDDNSRLAEKINEYRATLENLRINKAQMETQVHAAEEQGRILRRELAAQQSSLRDLENELFAENRRFDEIAAQIEELEGEIASIERQGRQLTEQLENIEAGISKRNKDVSGKQEMLRKKTAEMGKCQEQLEKLHMDMATSDTEIRNVKDNFRETHSRDLMEFEERMYEITVPAASLREQLAAERQKLKDLGNVNLMAPEEFAEKKEHYEFLAGQIADLQKAREDLARITEEIRAESTELFLATYNKIKKNFHNMFRRLFGGGRAELRLLDPQNVLESGVDIFAQPPGKKLENIALLSGGEKTMTAVALLFATYMVRPSPFCLLDEIDAALDEQNVLRFVHALREFANVSQYIVITHNKKTVSGAGTMLGVTMEESGVSKVITIKLDKESGGLITLPDIEPVAEEDVAPEENVYIPPRPPKRQKHVDAKASSAADESASAADGGNSASAGADGAQIQSDSADENGAFDRPPTESETHG